MFKTIFSGHNEIWQHKRLGKLPPNALLPWLRANYRYAADRTDNHKIAKGDFGQPDR